MRDTVFKNPRSLQVRLVFLLIAVLLLLVAPGALRSEENPDASGRYIVKGTSSERMAELVTEVGGSVTHHLKIIRAVGAQLTENQRDTLAEHPDVSRIWEDRETGLQ